MSTHRFYHIYGMALQVQKNEYGQIQITDHALAAIAGITAQRMPEIASLDAGLVADLTSILGKDPNTIGVKIESNEDEVRVDLNIRVYYGSRIPDVVLRLQEQVRSALETYADISVLAINVYVQAVVFEDEKDEADT